MLILILVYFYREVLKDWNSLLDIATDQEIPSSWARMQERSTACNKTEFRRWSQASGTDYSQQSLLLSDKLKSQNLLRPITQYMHDYMHGLCPNGVLNWVVFLWIQSLASSGVAGMCKTHGSVQLWAQPAIHKCNLQRLFLPKAVEDHKKAGKFKCSSSEILVCTRSWHTMSKFVACLMAFVFWGQLAFWLGTKFWTIAYPSLLWQRLTTSNCFHLLKQHWRQLLQLAGLKNSSQRCTGHFINYSQSLQRHGQLPACWTMERKHKDIRKHGNVLCNTTHWETSLMKSVIAEHIYTLGEESSLFREGTCLQNATGAPQRRWRHPYAMLARFLWECLASRALVANFLLGQQLLLVVLSICTMWMEAHQLSMQLKSIVFWKSLVVMWPLSKNICSRKFQMNKMFPHGQWRCPEIRALLLYKKSRVLSLSMLPKAKWHVSPQFASTASVFGR